MIIHIPSGKRFENRAQAKAYFGSANYKYRVRNREFTFHDNREVMPDSLTENLRDGECEAKIYNNSKMYADMPRLQI